MSKVLPFERSEFEQRTQKVKKSMSAAGIELLMITEPTNMYYVGGYEALSYYVPQTVIVSLDLDEPVCIVRLQDLYCATETTWMSEENVMAYPDKYLWEPKNKHVMDFIADFLKEKGLDKKKIGLEMDTFYLPAYWCQRLEKMLPNASFSDATNLVNWIRGEKSPRELEYMSIAARTVEKAMAGAIHDMDEGVRECHVAAGICKNLVEGNGIFGGDFPALPPIMPAGERTAGAHFSWTTEGKYKDGQLVYMEIAGSYKRYHAPLTRTVFIGKAPDKVQDTAKAVIEGLDNALAAIKPGAVVEDVEKVWQKTINKYGFEKESRMGYAIGIAYPPVWTENTIYFKPGEKSVLKPNMTFHMMPGLWLDGYGVAITETIRVTENGCESITKFPRKLLTTKDF